MSEDLNLSNGDPFLGILCLLHQEDVVVKMVLKLFIAIVDANRTEVRERQRQREKGGERRRVSHQSCSKLLC
jgi:hypothetical protein